MSNTPLPIDNRKPPAGKLIEAARSDDKYEVTRLLNRGADINERDEQGNTALYHAANRGYTELARLLAERGANIDTRNKAGDTPIMGAVLGYSSSRDAVIRLLASKGANIDIKNNAGETLLSLALKRSAPSTLETVRKIVAERQALAEKFAREAEDRRRAETANKQERLKAQPGSKLKPGPAKPKPPQAG